MSSSIPNAVTQFQAIATAALPAGTTNITMGEALPPDISEPVVLQIIRVTGEQEWAELGPLYRREETYAIHCEITAWAGDQDFATRMTDAFSAFELLTVAVGSNPTLNGAVRLAEIRQLDWEPKPDAKGQSTACIAFTVDCQQRITTLT